MSTPHRSHERPHRNPPGPAGRLGLIASACALLLSSAACADLWPGTPEAPPLMPPPTDHELPPTTPPVDPTPAPDAPVTLTAIDPTEGPVGGGIDVVVRGTGFRAGLEVLFGESPASDLFILSPTTAVVRAPPRPAGRVDVTVFHPRAAGEPSTLPAAFRYFDAIAVFHADPAKGPVDGGVPIAVFGRGFTPDTRVFFDGRPALSQEVIGDSLVRGILPPGRHGPVAVHAVGINGAAALPLGFLYVRPPELASLTPIVGGPLTRVTLEGEGLAEDSVVTFGDLFAEVVATAPDGRSLVALAPPLETSTTRLVDVTVATSAGTATLPDAFAYRPGPPAAFDPLVLACSHLLPASGPAAGGTRVELACHGLAYGELTVRFGPTPATVLEVDVAGGRLLVRAPPNPASPESGPATVEVTVRTAAAGPVPAGRFTWLAPSPLAVTAASPNAGPTSGGTLISIAGRGFTPGLSVTVGALAATDLTVLDPTRATLRTPPGVPGLADITVRASGLSARLERAFDYTSERLSLALVDPPIAARAGNTWLRVFGEGFTPTTRVLIGGALAPPIAFVSSAELLVRSPRLPVGVHDVEVLDDNVPSHDGAIAPATSPRRDRRERLFTSFDPRSGTGGTWGPPIGGTPSGTLNVTVWGSGGYGPVEGAFVMVGHDPATPWRGFTDDQGQVTLSGPGLAGPLDVTASRDGFTAYSILAFDAQNVTVLLAQNPTPPPSQGSGGNTPPTMPPNGTLRGRVIGLDKYVVAPPGSCEAHAIPETRHCAACDPSLPDGGCGGDPAFACLDFSTPGQNLDRHYCVATCDAGCPEGYTCAASAQGPRCLPSPGERRAYCNVTSTSRYGYEYPIQSRGWVDAAGTFELDSRRLGELAIYCFGGYQASSANGQTFLPTVMGVRRHVFVGAGAQMDGLDVELSHPLDRSFRFHLQDPPRWSAGLMPPNVVISLDLGPDGVIPFSRALVPTQTGPERAATLWIAPSQLAALSGNIHDAHYLLYTTLAPANTASSQPRSYNLVQFVRSIVEDRLPVRDAQGWRLEGHQAAVDLHGAFLADDTEGVRAWAVGDNGRILLWSGTSWSRQTSGTTETLNAVHGTGGRDVWAVGDAGTVRHWDGIAWRPVPAPFDDYGAVLVSADTVLAAGRVRLRAYDRQAGTWSLVGGPSTQEVRGLVQTDEGVLALATGGRILVIPPPSPEGSPSPPATLTSVSRTPRAGLVRRHGEHAGGIVLVGDGGLVVSGPSVHALTERPTRTSNDLTALAETADGQLVIVGDNGVALRGPDVESLVVETIPNYRSKAHAVLAMPSGEVRVVGSAAFILGPFLHFPTITAPLHELALDRLAFGWTWTGPDAQYTRLALTPEGSNTIWTVIVDGDEQVAILPDLQAAAGLAPLPRGRYRFEVLRVLNPNFDINAFTTRDFNLSQRESWATNEAWFVLP